LPISKVWLLTWTPGQATRPHDVVLVVVCNEGYASSLAADNLRRLGVASATDLIGGFRAWAAAGLPTVPGGSAAVP
jgi:rhodanese-related sulfurtransferase